MFSRMSDPLDPTDAIIGGVADSVKRLGSSILATVSAVVLGLNFHAIPKCIVTVQTNGLNSASWFFALWPPFNWGEMMIRSLLIWYLIPFFLGYSCLILNQFMRDEMFGSLLGIIVVHSVHTFLYTQMVDPLPPADLILACSVLVVGEFALVGLLLWWRQIRLNASFISSAE
jgi:hypothetical protein